MRLLLSYLWQSPLVRLTIFWFVLAMVGISLFSWKISGMRAELAHTNQKIEGTIKALQQIDKEVETEQTELNKVLEEIERFRPTVPDLLPFVTTVEELAESRKISMKLATIQTGQERDNQIQEKVTYRLEISASLDTVQSFLQAFENLPYAITIDSLDVRQTDIAALILTFILHTKFS
ncbi:MAG: hypothetical protein Q8P95_01825 [bacterium]|nr:hypothetical protein [bacterium]